MSTLADQQKLDGLQWKASFSLISYGVRIGIRSNEPTLLEALVDYLPPGWEPSSSTEVDELYSAIATHPSTKSQYLLYRGQEKLTRSKELREVLDLLNADLCLRVGMLARDKLFVHAGVVGWHGKAIVMPGRSFSGKTTLVAAFVKAGASYYSDEYAVFDAEGQVHPYPRRLAIRQGKNQRKKRCSVEELGGTSGKAPLPVGLVVCAKYQLGARWSPRPISPGEAVLALLDNTIVARTRPEFALPILPRAVSGALTIEGQRGEASEVAAKLLQHLKEDIKFVI
jgi:hypothetical protein